MKIYSNGKDRTLTGSFPARFKLLNNGVEVPFIRTGKGSVRLSGEIPFGELDVEEVIKQKTPQPAKLDAQSIAIINKADFDQIDLLNKKLAINQEQMNAHLSALTEHEATLANLETQNAQAIEQTNESMTEMAKVFGKEIQADRERIKATAKSIAQDIAVSSEVLNAKIEAHEKAKNPHKITKETIGLDKVENTSDLDKPVSKATQKALDKKADKSDIEDVRKEIKETEKKQERLVKSIDNANLYGGIGGNELPIGGKTGQILGKKSDKTGDYGWFDNSAKPKWGDIGGNINNQTDLKNALDSKQNVIDDLDTIRAGATDGSTALQPNDDISELNNNVGYITGITSSDVVTALGYTPYDSTNPDDFQTGQEVASAVSAETTNRENADNNLQGQIDAITASSDVKDIVGTYAQLQAYDTSTLGNNDIIKVLQDETHSNETTYYRWSTTTETFTLIGEEGPYYTKSEANSTFVPQTRTVNGKALSSDISLTYSDVGAQQAGNYVTTNTVQTITEAKTFTKAVHFTGTGDNNAVFITENTRFDIEGTTRTILGMGSAQFYINHSAYALLLRGKNARPSYNSSTSYLALLSDLDGYVPNTRTVNGKALSSDISLTASDVGALPDSTVIPTVNDATLTIQKNGTDVATFTANSSTNQTANITVPTDTSDLTNGAGFITGITSGDVTTALGYTPYDASNPSGYTSNVGTVTSVNNTSPDGNGNVSLSIPTVNDSTITIQKNGTTVDSFTTNASSNKSINITVPTSAADVSALPSSTKYGADLSYSSNTLQLKDQDGNNLGSAVTISGGGSLPSQTGNSGKFLTTDGTDASWANIPSDSSKANTSLDNLTATGKKNIDSYVMPSTTYENKSYTKGNNYTAPGNGYFYLRATGGGSGAWLTISLGNATSSSDYITYKSDAGNTLTVIAPVAKNQVITPSNSGNSVSTFRFYYAKGEN